MFPGEPRWSGGDAVAREPRARYRSDSSSNDSETRLAHWPPPFRKVPAKPRVEKRVKSEEPVRVKPRGWRITRGMFSEFEE
jgi:hypothetical protein